MQIFRLCSMRHQATAFTRLGASLAGGRWNHRGEAVVYTGGSLSFAALECLVHFSKQTLPSDYISFTVTVPKGIKIAKITASSLPKEWWEEDPPITTQALGSEWLQRQSSVLLEVPSAIIPSEFNYLINPNHKDFAKLMIAPPVAFRFDSRLK